MIIFYSVANCTTDEVNQFANGIFNILKKYGATKGNGVSLIMPNCVQYG